MAMSDLAKYNEYAHLGLIEVLDQKIALFNEASQGTIILKSGGENKGDYNEKAMFRLLGTIIRDRDPADNTTVVAPISLSHIKERSVKIGTGTKPLTLSDAELHWIGQNPEEAGALAGQAIAGNLLQVYLNNAIAIAKNVIDSSTDTSIDLTTSKMVPVNYVKAAAKFGDRSNALRCWVTHSTPIHDLWANNMNNAQSLFNYGTVNVMRDPFGRVFIISDSPDLIDVVGSVNNYSTLGLTENAITIEQNNDYFANVETNNGLNNIVRTMQSQWSYNVSVKGFAWNKTAGANVTTSILKDAANWDQYVTSHKDTAGVVMQTL